MKLEVVKTQADYTIFWKRNKKRYAVKKNGAFVNGEEKTKVLLDGNFIKLYAKQAKPEEPAAETEESGE